MSKEYSSEVCLQKLDFLGPMVALEVASVPISFKNETSILYFARGPLLMVQFMPRNSQQIYDKIASKMLFEHSNISGIKSYTNAGDFGLIVWAGRSIAILIHKFDYSSECQSPTHTLISIFEIDDNLDDNVLDSSILFSPHESKLIVGYAHNFIDVMINNSKSSEAKFVHFQRFQCPDICVLFSLSLSVRNYDEIVIASGTAFGKIILWKISTETNIESSISSTKENNKNCEILINIYGHEGVIFRMKWSNDNTKLLSISDDRTVRLWNLSLTPPPILHENQIRNETEYSTHFVSNYEQVFVGWGHVSRLWDVCFLDDSNNDGTITCNRIATASEDGTIKIWNYLGECLSTMKGHEGSVWRIMSVLNGQLLISGGNDGAIKLWHTMHHNRASSEDPSSFQIYLSIPDWPRTLEDRKILTLEICGHIAVNGSSDNDCTNDVTEEISKPVNKNSRRQNGVCGVFIDPIRNLLVVILIEGGIWVVDVETYSRTRNPQGTAGLSNEFTGWKKAGGLEKTISRTHVKFLSGDVPRRGYDILVACAHSDSSVSITMLKQSQITSDVPVQWFIVKSICWVAHELRAVNIWILDVSEDDDGGSEVHILTASVKGSSRLWKVCDGLERSQDIEKENDKAYLILGCSTGRSEIATSCLLSEVHQFSHPSISEREIHYRLLFIGYSRGTIAIFSQCQSNIFPTVMRELQGVSDPIAFLPKLHGSDPVTCLVTCTNGMMSVGHDGFLNIYHLELDILQCHSGSELFLKHFSEGKSDASEFKNLSNSGGFVGTLPFPLNPLTLISKQSCLPIKSPDLIIIHNENKIEHASIYIGRSAVSTYFIMYILYIFDQFCDGKFFS